MFRRILFGRLIGDACLAFDITPVMNFRAGEGGFFLLINFSLCGRSSSAVRSCKKKNFDTFILLYYLFIYTSGRKCWEIMRRGNTFWAAWAGASKSKFSVALIAFALSLPAGLVFSENASSDISHPTIIPPANTFYKQNDMIVLAAAQFDVKVGPQNLASELVIDRYDDRVSGWYLVKFNDAIDEYWVASLKAMGANIGSYVPYNTYMVKMDADTMAQVQELPFVRSVSIYQPAYKVDPTLFQGVTLKQGLQSADALSFINYNTLYEQASTIGTKSDITQVSIYLQQGENPYNLAALISKHNGKVLAMTDNSVRAEISKQGMQTLAFVNNIEYIMPYYMPVPLLADTAWTEQSKVSGSTPVWTAGLHGEGVTIGIADTGLDTDHDHFRQNGWPDPDWIGVSPTHRKVTAYYQLGDNRVDYIGGAAADSGHGTHVTGIAVGNGAYVGSGNVNRYGMAYEARVAFCDIGKSNDGSGNNDATLGGIPADLKTMYALQKVANASLASNSWGVSVGMDTNGDTVKDARTYNEGKYTEDSLNSDWFQWQNKEFQIFFANGNDRGSSTFGGAPFNSTTCPPATGKNMVSVGAHSAGAAWQSLMSFSSWGPTLDGRLKPDVTSTGVEDSALTDGNRDGAADTGYQSMQGTSMASPCALGGAALISQYYRAGYYPVTASSPVATNGFVPSNALIKATMINGARDGGTSLYPYVLNGFAMQYPNGDAGWGAVTPGIHSTSMAMPAKYGPMTTRRDSSPVN
jgi:serine protease AprX